jgi:hypothetical protein
MRFAMLLSAVALPALVAGNAAAGLAGPAGDQPISAVKLQLKRNSNGKEKLLFLSKDTALVAPAAGGADDPTAVGATVELCSGTGGYALFELPASGWKGGKILKYVQKGGPPSGVKNMLLKGGRAMKVVGKDAGLDLSAPQGQVAVRVTMGTKRMCALFAGAAVKTDAAGVFDGRAAAAGAVADCSDAALGCVVSSPSGAFLAR